MDIPFIKMEGCGNDYVYIDCMRGDISQPEALAAAISHRHFGVGSDGLVLLCRSDCAAVKMRMFNLDGSEGGMCGNALRCVAKLFCDLGYSSTKTFVVETASGLRQVTLDEYCSEGAVVTANMGRALLTPAEIPVLLSGDSVIDRPLKLQTGTYRVTCVSMGNPHAVVFLDDVAGADLEKIGRDFQDSGLFPSGVNTELVRFVDAAHLEMRVWERGSGETQACGTGACAAAAAAVLLGLCPPDSPIEVALSGGMLTIRYTSDGVFMTGPCRTVFTGIYAWK